MTSRSGTMPGRLHRRPSHRRPLETNSSSWRSSRVEPSAPGARGISIALGFRRSSQCSGKGGAAVSEEKRVPQRREERSALGADPGLLVPGRSRRPTRGRPVTGPPGCAALIGECRHA
jgi:hypothetical protein